MCFFLTKKSGKLVVNSWLTFAFQLIQLIQRLIAIASREVQPLRHAVFVALIVTDNTSVVRSTGILLRCTIVNI